MMQFSNNKILSTLDKISMSIIISTKKKSQIVNIKGMQNGEIYNI